MKESLTKERWNPFRRISMQTHFTPLQKIQSLSTDF